MTHDLGPDPLDDLRRADPAADPPPSASLARIRARIEESTMDQPLGRTPTTAPLAVRFGRRWAALGAASLVFAAAAFLAFGRGVPPGAGPDPSGGTNIGSCVEQYSLANLTRRAFAFDGTVTAIAGDAVTFAIGTSYRGVLGDTVTLTATGMTGVSITSAAGPTLEVGERYLVSGEERFAWGCGFTQPYDPAVAAEWAAAFAG